MSGNGDAQAFRDAIIGVSLELGQAYGEDGVTMRAIASRLGTSATALYSCFESKAAIMRDLRVRGVVSLVRAMLEPPPSGDGGECIAVVSRRYIAFARDNPWLYRVVFLEDSVFHSGASPTEVTALQEVTAQFSARFIEWLAAHSGRRPTHEARVVGQWWATMHGLAALLLARHITPSSDYLPVGDLQDFIEAFISNTVAGLAAMR